MLYGVLPHAPALAHRGARPHTAAARTRSLCARPRRGPGATRSDLEMPLLDLILAAGFARPGVYAPLWIARRRVMPDPRSPEPAPVGEAERARSRYNPHGRAR